MAVKSGHLKPSLSGAVEEWEEIIATQSPELPPGVWARLASAHRKMSNTDAVLDVAMRAEKNRGVSLALCDEVATALVNAEREQEAIDRGSPIPDYRVDA